MANIYRGTQTLPDRFKVRIKAYTDKELRSGARLTRRKNILALKERLDNTYLSFVTDMGEVNIDIFSKEIVR